MKTFRFHPIKSLMKSNGGFSLIELVVSLAILGLLASMAAPMMDLVHKRQQEHELRNALREIRQAIDAYKAASDNGVIGHMADESGYPPTLEALYQGVLDTSDTRKRKKYFLRRLPRDPFYPDASVPAADTWGKRSYASEYNRPRAGDDVFDVYSLSPDKALDGSFYSDW